MNCHSIILWNLSEDLCFLWQTKPEMEMWNDLNICFRLEEESIKVNKEVATTPPPIQWPPSAFVGQRQWSCRGQRQGIGGTGTSRNHPWRLPRRPVGSRFSHVCGIRTSISSTSWLDSRRGVQSSACVQRTGLRWAIIHPPLQCEVALPPGSEIWCKRAKTLSLEDFLGSVNILQTPSALTYSASSSFGLQILTS